MLMFLFAVIELDNEKDRTFMERIYIEYRGIMYYQAYKILNNDSDAEDVISDCWITFCRHLPKLRQLDGKSSDDLKRYIARSVQNASINLKKKNIRKKEIFSDEYDVLIASAETSEQTAEEQMVEKIGIDDLKEALRSMPRQYYQALQMKYTDEMDDEQIAALLGISKSSVRAYVGTGRRLARKMLTERRDDDA